MPFQKCLKVAQWQSLLLLLLFFFFLLIMAKICPKKKKKNHVAKEAEGMFMPVLRSHIYLFLVPSKAQYTVISIIACSLHKDR